MKGDPRCVQEEVLAAGIDINASNVNCAYCLLFFCSTFLSESVLGNSLGWFSKWFLDVKFWESSYLAQKIHWVCLKRFLFATSMRLSFPLWVRSWVVIS